MKLQLTKTNFSDKLTQAARFTSSKFSNLSTLSGVLIEGKGKEIHFYSSNLSSYYHTSLRVKEEVQFSYVIEAKKILEFLSFLGNPQISIEFKEKEITISQEKTKASFPIQTPADFPLPPKIKEEKQPIKTEVLVKEVPLVLFAASVDESRPALSGVNFVTSEEEFIIVATDGFRLSLLKGKRDVKFPSMLIPRDFLSEVIRVAKEEKEVLFGYSEAEKTIIFQVGENEFYSRLIDGDFPPYESVVPTEKKTSVTLDREEFLRNIKLVSVFARDSSNIILFNAKKDGLYLRPKTEVEGQNEAFQEAKLEGDEQTVAFNFKFLLEFLNNSGAKQITVEILRPDAPVVFRVDNQKNFIHIIMPIRIQQ